VTEERTRTVVVNAANGILRSSVDSPQITGPCTARVVKYIAKSAAKNINSLESHTIVPTATTFGLVILCIEAGSEAALETVLVMWVIIPEIAAIHLFISLYLPLICPSLR
jgi:hypothetical protein